MTGKPLNQRNRPMLHFTRGKAFGMNVAEFFQFQRTFQSHREQHITTQIKRYAPVSSCAIGRISANNPSDRPTIEGSF